MSFKLITSSTIHQKRHGISFGASTDSTTEENFSRYINNVFTIILKYIL